MLDLLMLFFALQANQPNRPGPFHGVWLVEARVTYSTCEGAVPGQERHMRLELTQNETEDEVIGFEQSEDKKRSYAESFVISLDPRPRGTGQAQARPSHVVLLERNGQVGMDMTLVDKDHFKGTRIASNARGNVANVSGKTTSSVRSCVILCNVVGKRFAANPGGR